MLETNRVPERKVYRFSPDLAQLLKLQLIILFTSRISPFIANTLITVLIEDYGPIFRIAVTAELFRHQLINVYIFRVPKKGQ